MSDPAEINVDELRRRARRRLVGAIVLALGAAVIVPMLLESDPKPLGESVAVKIPPVDDGKFVNRLSDTAPGTAAKDAHKDAPADAARKSPPEADKAAAPASPPPRPPKYDTQLPGDKPADASALAPAPKAADDARAGKDVAGSEAAAKDAAPKAAAPAGGSAVPAAPATPAPAPAPAAPPKAEAKAEPAPAARTDAKPDAPVQGEAKPVPAPAPPSDATAPAAAPATREGFAVQLAAFSDDKGANALANRLKRGGYPAYTEPLKTSRGTLWRVRVGPYPTREAANGVRDKLKGEGQNGIVAAAH